MGRRALTTGTLTVELLIQLILAAASVNQSRRPRGSDEAEYRSVNNDRYRGDRLLEGIFRPGAED